MFPLCERKTRICISIGRPSGNRSGVTSLKLQIAAASVPPSMKLKYFHSLPTLMPRETPAPARSLNRSSP